MAWSPRGRDYTPLFNPNGELHPSLSVAAIFPVGRTVMAFGGEWTDPSKSESLTQPNSMSSS